MRRCLAVLVLLLACRLPAISEEKEPSALQIFDRALAAFDAQRVSLRASQYHQTLITHQIDGSGKTVARGVWKSIVRPGDPRPLEYTGERMDGQLSFFKSESSPSPSPSPSSPSASPSPKAKSRDESEEKNQSESA